MNENDIKSRMREHMVVFVCLIGLTLLAVWVSQNGSGPVRVIVLGIVASQVIMVGGILMHLMGEKPAVTALLVLTAFLASALFALMFGTHNDPLTGMQRVEQTSTTQVVAEGTH